MGADRSRPRPAVTDSGVTLHAAADISDTVFVTTTNLRPINPDLAAAVWICSAQIVVTTNNSLSRLTLGRVRFLTNQVYFRLYQLEIVILKPAHEFNVITYWSVILL